MNIYAPPVLSRRAVAPLFFAAALIFAFAIHAAAQTGNAAADRQLQMWREFSPPNGNFTVSLPAQPEGAQIPMQVQDTTLEAQAYASQSGGSTFVVSYFDHPSAPKTAEDIEDGFEIVRAKIIETGNLGVLTGEKKITVKNHPGREYSLQNGASKVTIRMILVKQRLYILHCATPVLRGMPDAIAKVFQAESNKFFESFAILDDKKVAANEKR